MANYIRFGTCNCCGQCCGAESGESNTSPWSSGYPESVRTWRMEDFRSVWPFVDLFGIEVIDGKIGYRFASGVAVVDGNIYPYRWISGRGLCKELIGRASKECPFLLPADGEGQYLCGLVGTSQEDLYMNKCFEGSCGVPPYELSKDRVSVWFRDHPLCSFTYEAV